MRAVTKGCIDCDATTSGMCAYHTRRELQKMMEAQMSSVSEMARKEEETAQNWSGILQEPTPTRKDGLLGQPKVAQEVQGSRLFSDDAATRKDYPVFMGVLMYFPDAIAAVAQVSKLGNDQHNPGQPLHWSRDKSTDQMDTAARHMMDHGIGYTKDSDGAYHLAKAAWRIMAELQLTIEKERRNQ